MINPAIRHPVPPVPAGRIRAVNDLSPVSGQDHVLYWMIATRRLEDNFALQRAAWWAAELGLPILILEALRCDYRWASERLHAFVIDGMADNAADALVAGVTYLPYVEPSAGAGRGLLQALSARAAVVVTDDYPTFFLPGMVARAARTLERRLEAVDSNGLVPMRATDKVHATAYGFRRYLQKVLPAHLDDLPLRHPAAALPRRDAPVGAEVRARWPPADIEALRRSGGLGPLPIDHGVAASHIRGGSRAAQRRLAAFLDTGLSRYASDRNHPDLDGSSGLSPYLHFGHLSVHRVFDALMSREGWTRRRVSATASGKREGWWNASAAAESFLDECITWREVGFNFCALREDHDRYESLPDWARASLDTHASDPREHVYAREQFEAAATHDAVWNAAQRQIVREGRMHNYMRMLWGKKILEWSASPQDALATMIDLNNTYGLDGRDPNSYSGIFWVLGRYDRPWAPRRPIFGIVRYMSSASAIRKLKLKRYLETYSEGAPSTLF